MEETIVDQIILWSVGRWGTPDTHDTAGFYHIPEHLVPGSRVRPPQFPSRSSLAGRVRFPPAPRFTHSASFPMPQVSFTSLPADARVWVFACDRELTDDQARQLLAQVDGYLGQWKAHGAPLRCAREWLHDRFLAVGIDPTAEQASGCSIDDLFRHLREIGNSLGTQMLGGGRVFYRAADGRTRSASRAEFSVLATRGDVTADTTVFDTSVILADDWRRRFERRAGDAWTAEFMTAS